MPNVNGLNVYTFYGYRVAFLGLPAMMVSGIVFAKNDFDAINRVQAKYKEELRDVHIYDNLKDDVIELQKLEGNVIIT